MEEILIDISPTGQVQVEGKGFKDATCTQLTKDLEKALGDVEKVTLKPEHRVAIGAARKTRA